MGNVHLSLAELISNPPKVHDNRSYTYGIDARLARFLDEHIAPDFVSLETGSGLSTLVILRKGIARHIAIAPAADEFLAIREFCTKNGIPTTGFEPITAGSQDRLPGTSLPALDLVLIDGDHSFPVPFIDWYYTADQLVVGGLMIVDDIQLVTGRLLVDFMDADPKWERVLYKETRFAVFRKLKHPIHEGGWWLQPYVVASNPVRRINVVRAATPGRGPVFWALIAVYARLPRGAQAFYRRVRSVLRGK